MAKVSAKMSDFIESRRKRGKLSKEELSKKMDFTTKTYKRKLQDESFSLSEIIRLGTLLEFEVQMIPNESPVYKAG
jgi:hypothetical protein